MRDDSIFLREEDFDNQVLDGCVDDLLALIVDDASFDALIKLMLDSAYWTEKNFHDKYDKWKQKNANYPLVKDKAGFDNAVKVGLRVSESSFGWSKLRGCFAEGLVEKVFAKWCASRNIGFSGSIYRGCAVYLKGERAEYLCAMDPKQQQLCRKEDRYCAFSRKDGCDGRRETVDLGVVTLIKGKDRMRLDCVETKLSPRSFHYLDGAYLSSLKKKLDLIGVEHEIIVASLERNSILKTRVATCMQDSNGIAVWGIEEIKKWYFA